MKIINIFIVGLLIFNLCYLMASNMVSKKPYTRDGFYPVIMIFPEDNEPIGTYEDNELYFGRDYSPEMHYPAEFVKYKDLEEYTKKVRKIFGENAIVI